MKILKMSEEIEKHLVTIFDAALKAGGMQVHHLVNLVINSIEQPASLGADQQPEIKIHQG